MSSTRRVKASEGRINKPTDLVETEKPQKPLSQVHASKQAQRRGQKFRADILVIDWGCELQTAVTIKPDELVMLGGLNQVKETASKSGFSFLPASMRSRSDNSSQTELLLVIHAQRI